MYMQNGGNYRGNGSGGGFQNRAPNRGGFQQFGRDSQYPPQKRDQSKNGESLRPVNYDNIAPFRKDFFNPSESVRNRSVDEVKALSQKFEISIVGRDASKYAPLSLFSEAGLPDYIMNEMQRQGFVQPTGIQAGSFPVVLSGRNLVGIAKTGSGKTLAYIIPALIHLKNQQPVKNGEGPIALVLAPTRELAQQIQIVVNEFGLKCQISNTCIFGGAPKHSQMRDLAKGVDIVIATPGRLIDFLERNVTNLKRCTYLVETKRRADEITRSVNRRGFNAVAIHGDKSQNERDFTLNSFRSGRMNVQILVATDVASRGLDVDDVKFVINYDYPNNSEDYVHRIGRTGRCQQKGTAYTLFTNNNSAKANDLINVLREANQIINPRLVELSKGSYGKRGNFKKGGQGMRHNGGGRDMRNGGSGGMRSAGPPGGMQNGMKRRWDSAGAGGGNKDFQNKRPYQPSSGFPPSSAPTSYAPKPAFRSNPYDQNKPPMTNAPPPSYPSQSGYGKFSGYAPMQMPPTLSTYSAPIASAIASYMNFPPPSSMPPLPKN